MPVAEMQMYVTTAVNARIDQGRKRAIDAAATEFGLTSRRVLAPLHGEVSRIWADELLSARAWYRNHLAKMAARSEHEAAVFRARIEEWDRNDG